MGSGAETGGAGCDCVGAGSPGRVGETSDRVPAVVVSVVERWSVGDGDPEPVVGAGEGADTSDTGSDIASAAGFESLSLGVSTVPSVVDSGPGDGTSLGPAGGGASSVAGGRTPALASGMAAEARAESEETSGRGHCWDTEPTAANAMGSMVGATGNSPSAMAREGSTSTTTEMAVTATGRRQPDLERKGKERCGSIRQSMCQTPRYPTDPQIDT